MIDHPKEDMQVEINLQFIGMLQIEEPPILEDEIKQLTEQKEGLKGAYEAFAKLIADLKEDIRVSPIATDLLKELKNSEPIEMVAGSVGICDLSGSNRATPDVAELSSKKASSDRTSTESNDSEASTKDDPDSSSEKVVDPFAKKTTDPPIEKTTEELEDGEVRRSSLGNQDITEPIAEEIRNPAAQAVDPVQGKEFEKKETEESVS